MDQDWNQVSSQTSSFVQSSSENILDVVNHTANELGSNTHRIEVASLPVAGTAGFLPGFIFGITRE